MATNVIGGGATSSGGSANFAGMNVMAGGWSSTGYYNLPSPKKTQYALSHQDGTNSRVVVDLGTVGNVGGTDFYLVQGSSQNTTLNTITPTATPTAVAVYSQWARSTTPTNAYSVGYLNGTYFYGNNLGNIYSSADLTTWTLRGTPVANAMVRGFAYGNSTYVALGFTTTTYMNATSTDGVTWTNRATSTPWTDVVFGAGKFVATSTSTNINYSTDGFTWTAVSGAVTTYSVAHNGLAAGSGSLFVAVGSGGISTSSDGVTWTSRSNPSGATLNSVAYGGGTWVAVGQGSNIIYSTDGLTWTSVGGTSLTGGTAATFNAVAYGSGRFYANADYISSQSGYGGGYVSTNGITWRPAGAMSNNGFPATSTKSLIYANARFYGASQSTYINTSADGLACGGAGFNLLGYGSPTLN